MKVQITEEKEIWFSEYLYKMLELMAERCVNRNSDVLLIVDGKEGSGKTTMSALIATVMSKSFGLHYDQSNLFFNVDKLLLKAGNCSKNIFIWDESALSGLSKQWFTKSQIKLLTYLMVGRKKNHFYIFNIPSMFRLQRDIVNRAIGLVHTYERNRIDKGFYSYHGEAGKDAMYRHWSKTKIEDYYKTVKFRATFPNVFADLIDEEEYDNLKDEMIKELVKDNSKKKVKEIDEVLDLKKKISMIPEVTGITYNQLGKALGVTSRAIFHWRKALIEGKNSLYNEANRGGE